ncbi:MAG: hypothetical protein ACK5N8_06540 [Alphaproteobacteria bacterium]
MLIFQVNAQSVKNFPTSSKSVEAIQKEVFSKLDTIVQAKGLNFVSAEGEFSAEDLIVYDWEKSVEMDLFDGSFGVLLYQQNSNENVVKSVVIYYEQAGKQDVQKIAFENIGEEKISNKINDYEISVSKWGVTILHIPSQKEFSVYFLYMNEMPKYC